MIILIHGNDNLGSRNYYLSQKDDNSLDFDAQNINLIELNQTIDGSGLFPSSKKIFIDNLFTNKGLKNQKEILALLGKNTNSDIFIYADKEISVKSLSEIKNLDSKLFKIPQNLWNFLDDIRPGNFQSIFKFHEVLKETEVEIIFSMIIRQFRLLLGSKSNSKNNISELSRFAPWQKSKFLRQSSLFKTNELKNIISKLYKIELNTKTGKSGLSLKQNIDIFLLEI